MKVFLTEWLSVIPCPGTTLWECPCCHIAQAWCPGTADADQVNPITKIKVCFFMGADTCQTSFRSNRPEMNSR